MARIHSRIMLLLLWVVLLLRGVVAVRAPGVLRRGRGWDLRVLLLGGRRGPEGDLWWGRLLLVLVLLGLLALAWGRDGEWWEGD